MILAKRFTNEWYLGKKLKCILKENNNKHIIKYISL